MMSYVSHGSTQPGTRWGLPNLFSWNENLTIQGAGMAVGSVIPVPLILGTGSTARITIDGGTNLVLFGSGAQVTTGGIFMNASSRALKQDIRGLTAAEAYEALHGLQPVKFAYTADPERTQVGFIAEDVPALVAAPDRAHLSAMDIVGVLTKVVQEQDAAIGEHRALIRSQQAAIATLSARLDAFDRGIRE
jgi:hypothetical protein